MVVLVTPQGGEAEGPREDGRRPRRSDDGARDGPRLRGRAAQPGPERGRPGEWRGEGVRPFEERRSLVYPLKDAQRRLPAAVTRPPSTGRPRALASAVTR